MVLFSISKCFLKISHQILYYTQAVILQELLFLYHVWRRNASGSVPQLILLNRRFMSPRPAWFMSSPEGAVEQCHSSQSLLGKPWYPSPCSERVGLHAGEYKAKFHTSFWSFQTLTSAKAAPLSQLWLTHGFLRPGRTINPIPWIQLSGKSHHYSKTRMIFASDQGTSPDLMVLVTVLLPPPAISVSSLSTTYLTPHFGSVGKK